ncbi:GAF domain-containing hybrid sensor histidine kinase/response regulator [Desulforhopalus singaporensis]|uniref:Sensory/regulatory protein RpfC n=1 Tax=Desulforhopalus singaporensis TaxID=91360 RepID=A0A1H0S3X6_9BACT|nr:response regulator [Desulforhopalus singaporensis]SDP36473.1 Signal transduction histidine kinase [Desulforhopalus singaporensis]
MKTTSHDSIAIPTLPVLEVAKELTIGQRTTDTTEKLTSFLHTTIFKKLGPFATEIYFLTPGTDKFDTSWSKPHRNTTLSVPPCFLNSSEIVQHLIATEEPLQIHGDSRFQQMLHPTGNKSHLVVPISVHAKLAGIIYFGTPENVIFHKEYRNSIQTIAAIIGSRLQSLDTIQQLKQSMEDLEHSERIRSALNEISEQAHYSININSLYAKLHHIVSQLIHAPNFYIAILKNKPDGKYIYFPYFADDYDAHFQGMESKLDSEKMFLTGYLLKTRKPLLLTPDNYETICQTNNLYCQGTKPHSWLGAPFYIDHAVAGAVAVQSYDRVVYTEQDKELMTFVARHIGDALRRKHRVDELRTAKERAEEAEKNKSTFLANMSHEIRTPMNGILGLTDLLLQSDIPGHQRTYLEMVHSSANRLLKLINDILDFSKIDAGKTELATAPFNLKNLLEELREILTISAAKKNIELKINYEKNLPDQLLGDEDKLSQILMNLIGNGIKFTSKGEVTVTVEQSLNSTSNPDSINLCFQIADTGIGIPTNQIPNAFKPFNQLKTTRETKQSGTGLGLAIAAELVEIMGGKLQVESCRGIGSCFQFTVAFPVVSQKAGDDRQNNPKQADTTPLPATPLNILLVEDEHINRTLGVVMLEREGWTVSTANDGLEAMIKYDENKFDMILMDIQMPEMDGLETTRLIRKNERISGAHVPIIAMTAYAVKGDREKCLEAGMDGYISKPIIPDKLRHEIATVLARTG